MEDSAVPEAAWLGLDPSSILIADGPLTIAALRADPPEKSVQFHLSLMSFENERIRKPEYSASPEQIRDLLQEAEKLNTSALTLVKGQELDHGLVWEKGSLDMHTWASDEAINKPVAEVLPVGDGDRMLRRYIDDSVNLLTPLEINQRRMDEELPPLNLLWPWGQGFRVPMPNLALRRGHPVWVESSSMRLEGLSRLVGYRHGDPLALSGKAEDIMPALRHRVFEHTTGIAVLSDLEKLNNLESQESAVRLMGIIFSQIIAPFKSPSEGQCELHILLPTGQTHCCNKTWPEEVDGLALHWCSDSKEHNSIPFDERAVEDRRLQRRTVWEVVDEALTA